MTTASIKQETGINKYLPIAILYFFFNSIFLPEGILYTTILTPLFLIWLYPYKSFQYIWVFFAISIPYALMHIIYGANLFYYTRSYILFFSVYVFIIAFYQFLQVCTSLRYLYKQLIIINFIFVVLACLAFFIPPLKGIFWMVSNVSQGLEKLARLKLFTYEPSYYSSLLAPIVLYYYLKLLLFKIPNRWFIFFIITFPLLLSFSFGVLIGIITSMLILFFADIKLFFVREKFVKNILLALFLILVGASILYKLYPENALFIRISNLFSGKDSSFRGRLFDSFYLAFKTIEQKSILFGCGPGQFKIVAQKLVVHFYSFTHLTDSVRLPNAVADTLVTFGITGLIFRFGLEIYFFFKTRVFSNYYRLVLFIFIFIYQFTGSYIVNISEYAIWILAFSSNFSEFDKTSVNAKPV